MSVLVYVENTDNKFKKSVFELVSYAKAIADGLNTQLTAISIGNVAQSELEKLGLYGASKVLNVNNAKLATFINQAYATVITQAAEQEHADIIVLANSFSGKGLIARIAIKFNAAVANGAIDLPDLTDGKFVIKKSAFSNKAFAYTELSAVKKIISLNPNVYKIVEKPENVLIEDFSAPVKEADLNTIIKDIIKETNKISLPEAEVVVAAGRGLKGPENWEIIEELANVLGAATACSKPVSDAGWRPHSEHVGQTGITISPNLYIAIGISGAIQHLAGVSSSKTIVVINKDPEAPFFKVADYGIVGDAFVIVPKLIEAVKSIKANG